MLSCANKSLVYAPISRLRRSFAGIRKMPTSKAIKKETCKQACSLFFYRLDWHFIHCFRVYYSITVATRPDPTVRPPSRYFNIILPHIFMVFSPKYSEKRLICTIYFYLPDFLAPFWHRKILKKFSSTVAGFCSANFILHRQFQTVIIRTWVLP